MDATNLRKLKNLPDILEALGLILARSALLYTLGHTDVLRADGSLPESESDEDANRIFSMLASQPVAHNLRSLPVLNTEGPQTFSTTILGMTVEIDIEGGIQSILIAEVALGSLEAFFATAIGQRVVPHTEKLSLNVIERSQTSKPSFEMNALDMTGTITWPAKLSPSSFENQRDICKFWAEVSGQALATCCIIEDAKEFLKKHYADEAVQHRMTIVAFASTSYHRVALRSISQLSDWQDVIKQSYALLSERPTLTLVRLTGKNADIEPQGGVPSMPKDHRAYSVKSVIDIHAWDQAKWKGTAYAYAPSQPPYMALLFENEEGGRKIFERWRERFSTQDENEEISVSIIRYLPRQSEHHYCILITSKLPETDSFNRDQIYSMTTRFMTMTPESDVNLETFFESYRRVGAFYILLAFWGRSGAPELAYDLAILKRNLTVKLAENVGEHDPESIALRI